MCLLGRGQKSLHCFHDLETKKDREKDEQKDSVGEKSASPKGLRVRTNTPQQPKRDSCDDEKDCWCALMSGSGAHDGKD